MITLNFHLILQYKYELFDIYLTVIQPAKQQNITDTNFKMATLKTMHLQSKNKMLSFTCMQYATPKPARPGLQKIQRQKTCYTVHHVMEQRLQNTAT